MRLQAISVDLNRFELLAYAAGCGNASKKMQTPHIYIYLYIHIYIYTKISGPISFIPLYSLTNCNCNCNKVGGFKGDVYTYIVTCINLQVRS